MNERNENSRPETNFRDAMRAAGLDYTGELIADGRLHRVKANGDRGPNGWYVLHGDHPAAGGFGCWKRGIQETWKSDGPDLSAEQRAEQQRRIDAAIQARKTEESRRHAGAAETAQRLYAAASDATSEHPYLARKGVKAHLGVRLGPWMKGRLAIANALLIPLRHPDGTLASLQAIFPQLEPTIGRDKDLLPGGKKTGAYFVIGDLQSSPVILIAEGYATAATLHEATGHAAVMAVDAGNLKPVATTLQTLYGSKTRILCADNDRATEGNPGLTKATAAAKASRARLAVPPFTDDEPGSDFNDLAALRGLEAVREAVESARTKKNKDSSHDSIESNFESSRSSPSSLSITYVFTQVFTDVKASSLSRAYFTIEAPNLEVDGEEHSTLMVESFAAQKIADAVRGRLAYDRCAQCWYGFTNTHWQALPAGAAEEFLMRVLYAGTQNLGFKARYLKAVQDLLKGGLLPMPESARGVIPFWNGLLDLAARNLVVATPDRAPRWCLPYEYDPQADCPRVKQWLRDIVRHHSQRAGR